MTPLHPGLAAWLAEDYEGRHCRIEIVCSDRGHDEDDEGKGCPPEFHYTAELSEMLYSGPLEPSSTGDYSMSTATHIGYGSNPAEAVDQALAQRTAWTTNT